MPKRRRAQEFKRALRTAVQQAQVEIEREERQQALLVLGTTSPLDDIFWRERESGGWCCPSCDYNHPLTILAEAREEIDAYLKEDA